MRPSPHAPSWVDGVEVDERRLQEYFHQKQHSLLLRGAANVMKHTLESLPTTRCEDGFLHFGDSLMLRGCATEGLLQVDIADAVQVADARAGVDGASLSTGRMIASCPRNVFTVSRASDNDGFGESVYVHYGQAFRMGVSAALSEKAMYLYASTSSTEGQGQDETLMCAYPRAAPATVWRVLHRDPKRRNLAKREVVQLQEEIILQSEATGHLLGTDTTVRMNHYGNEWRVFGAPAGDGPASLSLTWTFVDSAWSDGLVQAARTQYMLEAGAARDIAGLDAGPDPAQLLLDPVAAADHELEVLEREVSDYSVLLRVYPLLRRAGMHTVRRLRTMCLSADLEGRGQLPARTFEGMLSWVGVRLQPGEMQKLANLFAVDEYEDTSILDYRGFFKYMEANMSEVRVTVVQDAYAKLQSASVEGFVEVQHLQRLWNPKCHPEVQAGVITRAEAIEDFLRQWDVASADGLVSYDEFLDYYRDVSMAVEQGEVFVDLVRKAWDL